MSKKTRSLLIALTLFSAFAWMQISAKKPYRVPLTGFRSFDKSAKIFKTVRQGGSSTYSSYNNGSYSSSSSYSGGSYSYGK